MYQGLASFCERISRETGDEAPTCYVRLRVGENRRTAQLIASRIEATGRDPVELATELQDRIDNSGIEAIWVEAMHRGQTNPTDSFRVPRREEDNQKEAPADRMAVVVERMARSADERAAGAEFRCQQAHERMLDLVETIWTERIKLRELELNAGGGMAEALKMAAPVLAMGAAKLLSGQSDEPEDSRDNEQPGQNSGAEMRESLETSVDQCIDFLTRATDENPDLITPDRIEAMTPLVARALGIDQ